MAFYFPWMDKIKLNHEERKKDESKPIITDIQLLQYKSLSKDFHALVDIVFGEDYYNSGMDVYSCNMLSCRDIAYKCGRKYGEAYDEYINKKRDR